MSSTSNGKNLGILVLDMSPDGPAVCRIIQKIGPEPTWVRQVEEFDAEGFTGKTADFRSDKPCLRLITGQWRNYALLLINGKVGFKIHGFNVVRRIVKSEHPPVIGIDNTDQKNGFMTASRAFGSTTSKRDLRAFELYMRQRLHELRELGLIK